MDGTFLTGRYGGVLLVATAQDANKQIYILAFAIVDSENNESWGYFFKLLKCCVPDSSEQAFISDRHASIKNAIEKHYPQSRQGVCVLHVKRNLSSKTRVEGMLDLFVRTTYCYKIQDFNELWTQIWAVSILIL